MTRNCKSTKEKEMWSNSVLGRALRCKTKKEMASRVRALAVIAQEGLRSVEECVATLQEAIDEMDDKELVKVYKAVDEDLSLWEMVLIKWACRTGEMKNHQALACHVDANKSHFLESMMLFGKIAETDTTSATTLVKKQTKGYLTIVQEGICFEMRPGVDVLHCSLPESPHVPDQSRGSDNWSWVHGP
jgi:hypothetical protein